jgi:hypothetical protein
MKVDKILKNNYPKDKHGQWHGYYVLFFPYLTLRVMYKHGLEIGYEEYHGLKKTNFYIK